MALRKNRKNLSVCICVHPWLNKVSFLSGFFLLSLILFPCAPSAREVTLTILFTNDHHGQVDPLHSDDLSKPVGGVTRRMALIEKIRKEVGPDHVVLVDSGDLFTGTAFSTLSRGQVDCDAYHLMRYDAVGLGESDFDYGRKTLLEYRKNFKIPWVSANVVSGGQPFLRPYVLKPMGVRVGLIGFSNPDTPALIGRENVRGLVFNPPGAAAKGLHSIFKKDADLFVVLSRLGVEEDKKFAKDNSFIHVVVGGHSHTLLTEPIVTKAKDGSLVGPLIVQAGSQGLYLGRLDLTVGGHRDPKTKKSEYSIVDYHYQLIPITADLSEDPQMVELVEHYKDRLKAKPLDEVLAAVSADLTPSEGGDSLIGEIAADAMRKSTGAEAALLENGFFKARFKSGNVTREILYEICPSDSEIVVIDVPGSSLRKALEQSMTRKGQDDFLQVSGLRIQQSGNELKVMVGEEPLNDRRKYQVAVNDFLAGGGGGYDFFPKLKSRRKTQVMLRDLLEEMMKDRQKITAGDLEKRWILP